MPTPKPGPLGPASIRQIHAIIHRALDQAVKWEWIPRNVASLATPPRLHRNPVKPVTLKAAVALLAAAREHDRDFGDAVHLAAATGARRGELCALRWSDVDLASGVIRIERSLAEVKGGRIEKPPKSYAERTVAIDIDTCRALTRRLNEQHQRARAAGVRLAPNAFVLSRQPDGMTPWLPSNLSGWWIRFAKDQGVKMRFHDWRHLSVSVGLDAGIPVNLVAERHGHRDAQITLGIYGHPLAGRNRDLADVIGKALGS